MASDGDRSAGIEHADALAAAIDAAEAAGMLAHGGPWGQLEMPDPVNGACCIASAVKGPQYCTCWEPEFDAGQQDPRPGKPGQRAARCPDCAYRRDSPERSGDDRYNGDAEFLERIAVTGEAFWCHVGIRRAVALVHPSGARVSLLHLGDYRPPVVGGVPYKADGTPGELCAGWAARRRAHLSREAAP